MKARPVPQGDATDVAGLGRDATILAELRRYLEGAGIPVTGTGAPQGGYVRCLCNVCECPTFISIPPHLVRWVGQTLSRPDCDDCFYGNHRGDRKPTACDAPHHDHRP